VNRRASAPIVIEGPHRRPTTAAHLLAAAVGIVFACAAVAHIAASIVRAAP
jgi:hypothetical protein